MSEQAKSWAVVDLGALRHNYEQIRRFVGVPVICVVKADAYGHGSVPVSQALVDAGAEMLAVACLEEAATLRTSGIGASLLLLSEADESEVDEGLELDLHFAVYSKSFLDLLAERARQAGRVAPIHLKVDTGMHRLGAGPKEALDLLEQAVALEGIALAGIWTHMAVADDPSDPFTRTQLAEFTTFLQEAEAMLEGRGAEERPLVHAANSAAALAFPEARFDAVRAGITLYGVRPSATFPMPEEVDLRPVLSWHSRVCLVKDVPPGARPSYGRTRAVESPRIAVVPVGYADGYLRSLSNRAEVLIGGLRHPVVGNVTMDYIVVECREEGLSNGRGVERGDEVVLCGPQGGEEVSAEELAERAGTIAYEILTRIGPRVRRVYVGGPT